jgi:hypothetical protein
MDDAATITAIFDAAFEDPSSLDDLLDAGGTHPIYLMAKASDHPRKDEIFEIAVRRSLQRMQDRPKPELEYVLGCRRPGSEGCDGVFVVAKETESKFITSAVFEGGTDYIGHPDTDEAARKTYDGFVDDGWVPMTPEDIRACAGVEVPPLTHVA